MSAFNYKAPAELYASSSKTGKRPMRYTRFKSAAEAIKYAVEVLPPELLLGSTLEVNEERFDGFGIRALYDNAHIPCAGGKLDRYNFPRHGPIDNWRGNH